MSKPEACPACGGTQTEDLGIVGPVPVLCGSLWDSREEAVSTPRAELSLSACSLCGHVWNRTFDPRLVEYEARYDNALDFSPTFIRYAASLVDRLVAAFDLRGKRVVEIGSGKGEFLRQLCAAGDNVGLGYDPTYEGPELDNGIQFVRQFFMPGTAPGEVDFVCCRHVLEHVPDPYGLLVDIRAAVGGRPVPMYFEVPNAEFNFSESGPWDLIYPHVGYFTRCSLEALLHRAGFAVQAMQPDFNGQFLSATVSVGNAPASGPGWREPLVPGGYGLAHGSAFRRQIAEVEEWRARLAQLSAYESVALWGAGSKGVTFLSMVDPAAEIGTVVDANPRKWGHYLPGAGHQVVGPDEVAARDVGVVLVMNRAYVDEIREMLGRSGRGRRMVLV